MQAPIAASWVREGGADASTGRSLDWGSSGLCVAAVQRALTGREIEDLGLDSLQDGVSDERTGVHDLDPDELPPLIQLGSDVRAQLDAVGLRLLGNDEVQDIFLG